MVTFFWTFLSVFKRQTALYTASQRSQKKAKFANFHQNSRIFVNFMTFLPVFKRQTAFYTASKGRQKTAKLVIFYEI